MNWLISSADFARVRQVFERLPPENRWPTLSPDYLVCDAGRSTDLEPWWFLYEEERLFWCHGVHIRPIPGGGQDAQSPYGYGGPWSNTADPGFHERAHAAYRAAVRERGIIVEFVRFHPLAEGVALYPGFSKSERQTVWVKLDGGSPVERYQGRVRTLLRKHGQDGAICRWVEGPSGMETFARHYRRAMTEIGARPFYHFGDTYFGRFAAWAAARLMICERGGDWLAAALFLQAGTCLEYHLAASTPEGRRIGAATRILDAAIRSARDQGLRRLYLGGGTDPSPDNPLFRFKAGFSPERASYRVGWQIHDPAAYAALETRLAERRRLDPNRILFHRDD